MFNKQDCILTKTLYLLKRHIAEKLRKIIRVGLRAVTSGGCYHRFSWQSSTAVDDLMLSQ